VVPRGGYSPPPARGGACAGRWRPRTPSAPGSSVKRGERGPGLGKGGRFSVQQVQATAVGVRACGAGRAAAGGGPPSPPAGPPTAASMTPPVLPKITPAPVPTPMGWSYASSGRLPGTRLSLVGGRALGVATGGRVPGGRGCSSPWASQRGGPPGPRRPYRTPCRPDLQVAPPSSPHQPPQLARGEHKVDVGVPPGPRRPHCAPRRPRPVPTPPHSPPSPPPSPHQPPQLAGGEHEVNMGVPRARRHLGARGLALFGGAGHD
jgi:hypothetical protein